MYKDASTLDRLREKLENTFTPKFEELREARAQRPSVGRTLALGGTGAILTGSAIRRSPHALKRLKKFLGPEMAKKLRARGTYSPSMIDVSDDIVSRMENLKSPRLKKIYSYLADRAYDRGSADPKKVVVDLFGDANRKAKALGRIGPTATRSQFNAAESREGLAKALSEIGMEGVTPRKILGSEVMKKHRSGESVRQTIKRLYPGIDDSSLLMKDRYGGAGGLVPDMQERARSVLDAPGWTKLIDDSVFEPFLQTKKMGPWSRFVNKKLGGNKLFNAIYDGRNAPDIKEYRMHAVDGKVVPWATGSKWDATRYFTPFRNREVASLERKTQGILDKLMQDSPTARSMNLRKQVLGMDVGVGKNGQPIIFELNPSMPKSVASAIAKDGGDPTYGSFQLLNPLFENAITAQAAGRMPIIQKIQLARDGTQAAIGGGLMYQGAKPWIPYVQQQRNQQKNASAIPTSLEALNELLGAR